LAEAQSQTKAISKQTDAIKRSAFAEIQSAHAQEKAAIIAIKARMPDIRLTRAVIDGFTSAPDKNGHVPVTMQLAFANFGGSAIYNPRTTVYPFIGQKLPPIPDFNGPSRFIMGGNDVSVMPGLGFGSKGAAPIGVTKQGADGVNSGALRFFAYGIVDYSDAGGTVHRFCFAYQI
jgi:hypothetical protein